MSAQSQIMTGTQHQQKSISPDEAKAIAQEAWIFGMPLVYIEIQIDTATHVSKVDQGHAPINQFVHYRAFPDASNRTVVGFNVDTLYSLAQLDLLESAAKLRNQLISGFQLAGGVVDSKRLKFAHPTPRDRTAVTCLCLAA